MDRRTFLATGTLGTLGALCACGGGESSAAPTGPAGPPAGGETPDGVTLTADAVTIDLARVPVLGADRGALIVRAASIIVVRVAADDYRAFTSICTHAGCTVGGVTGERIRCPCHGSEFDFGGSVRQGPAESPLFRYDVTYEADAGRLVIRRV